MLFCYHKSVHILMSLTTVVCVRWVVDSVSVAEGINRNVALRVISEGVFARPISIGVACSPVRASDVSAGNMFTCVCTVCTYVHMYYACIVHCIYVRMHSCTCGVLYVSVCMYVHLYFMCIIYICNPLKHNIYTPCFHVCNVNSQPITNDISIIIIYLYNCSYVFYH